MKKISKKNMPVYPPITSTLVAVLAMDYWDAPGWLWGAVGLWILLIWIVFFVDRNKEESVDVIELLTGKAAKKG